jgi:hypothetical protein
VNFLQLCQSAAINCGVASTSAIATALPTVVNATGALGRIVGWIGDAWSDLQAAQDDWDWMRSSVLLGGGVTFQTIGGQASYRIGTNPGQVGVAWANFGKWDREAIRNNTTANGFLDEIYMGDVTFDQWRDQYMFGAQRAVQTRPYVVAVGPDQSLNLGPPPNSLYTVNADYFTAPAIMVVDTDSPILLPVKFHMTIVYSAMIKYGEYESADEVVQRGTREYNRMYNLLLSARGNEMSLGGALA